MKEEFVTDEICALRQTLSSNTVIELKVKLEEIHNETKQLRLEVQDFKLKLHLLDYKASAYGMLGSGLVLIGAYILSKLTQTSIGG